MIRQKLVSEFHLAAPTGGLNTVDPPSMLPVGDAAVLVNMINGEAGLRVRLGFPEWCTTVDNANAEIRSILTYKGSVPGYDKLFACTVNGIFDCTASAAGVTTATGTGKAFTNAAGNAGYGFALPFVSGGGVRCLIYTDEANGYHILTEGGAWAQVQQGAGGAQISGVNPNLFAQAILFKSRIWFVEAGSTRAWYLAAGSMYGAATQFDFGQQFKRGGNLACLAVWTMDGGSGADDMLVAISTVGEVVIYQGTDPAQVGTFSRVGGWDLGGVPLGRRLVTTFGGELLILTTTGVIPVSRLISGRTLLSPDQFVTRKVRNAFNALMLDRRNMLGWSITAHPSDNSLIVTYPVLPGEVRRQFATALVNGSWGFYEGLPIFSADAWGGDLYFGTTDGRVCIMKGYIDNVARDGSTANAKAIISYGQTAFQNGGKPVQKRLHMIRANFVAQGAAPACTVEARTDFDTSPILSVLPAPALPPNAWDNGKWDQAVFAGDGTGFPVAQTFGACGLGAHISVAWKLATVTRTNLVGFDITVEAGGFR